MIMHRKPAGNLPTAEQIQNARYLREIVGDNVAERMNEVTATIFAQMGGKSLLVPGVKKPYAIAGKHNEGGLLIKLDQAIAKDRGTFFIVSYDYGADTYAVHYFRKVSDTPQAFDLLYEGDDIYCDTLCELFTMKTGIEIPPVEFGPAVIADLDQQGTHPMTFILTINTDSAAFDDDYRNEEITRILRAAADQVQYHGVNATGILRDINGNVCGEFTTRHNKG